MSGFMERMLRKFYPGALTISEEEEEEEIKIQRNVSLFAPQLSSSFSCLFFRALVNVLRLGVNCTWISCRAKERTLFVNLFVTINGFLELAKCVIDFLVWAISGWRRLVEITQDEMPRIHRLKSRGNT